MNEEQRTRELSIKLKNKNCPYVTYIDTDSVMISLCDEKIEDIEEIFNSEFDEVIKKEFIDKYNPSCPDKYNMINLEHENHLDYFFSSGVKKRYYCIRDDGSTYIRGLSIIRKDTPKLLQSKLNVLAKKIVMGKINYEDVIDLYNTVLNESLVRIGIAKGFGKAFEDYTKVVPQHVKAAKFANTFANININSTDKPYMFFVKSYENTPTKKDENKMSWVSKEICLMEEHFCIFDEYKDTLKLDYIEFFDRQVIKPLHEFIYSAQLKAILVLYMDSQKDFYSKFFNRAVRVAKKLKENKRVTSGIYEWVHIWNFVFSFSSITELTKENILK